MRRSIGPGPPTRKAITRAAPKRSAKRSSSSAIADAKSAETAEAGSSTDKGSAALVRRRRWELPEQQRRVELAGAPGHSLPGQPHHCTLLKNIQLVRSTRGSQSGTGIERFAEHKRQRYLSASELKRLGEALRLAEERNLVSPFALGAIRLLLFTGARLSEVLTLRWEHVDRERSSLQLPDSKTRR